MLLRTLVVVALSLISGSLAAQAVAAKPIEQVMAQVVPERISVSFENTPLADALWTIARRSGTTVAFDRRVLPNKRVNYRAENITPDVAFAAALKGTGLGVNRTKDGVFMLVDARGENAAKSQGVITGAVTDAKTGKVISGATVTIGSDTRSITTGEDGSYRITGISAGTHTVSVRLVGYAKQTRSVTIGEGATVTIDFKLDPSANVLDQVVVTGTVVQTELKAIPNAITVITARQIEDRGITRIDQLFRGEIPGLFAQNRGSGSTLDEVVMFSRGVTALSTFSAGISTDQTLGGVSFGTNPIKTYVDGVQLADSKYLSQIDPKSIERIEILMGPQASTIYGSNAINGVMQIFTKRGSTSRPQLTLNLLSGWVENNFSRARTPQHDYNVQLSGMEGRFSYNAGGSWNYMGPWTPAKQIARTGGFGGARLDFSIPVGLVTTDMTIRHTITQNRQHGNAQQIGAGYRETGWYSSQSSSNSLSVPTIYSLKGQTLGVVLGYVPTGWWSHELGIGFDVSDAETRYTSRGYVSISDTTLLLLENHTDRKSLRYTTIVRAPITSFAQAVVTAGADAWQNLISSWSISSQTLTGQLVGSTNVFREPNHNAGGFMQSQIGIKDRLFLTYGLRAEWNPAFGREAQPNYSPRYGMTYTQEFRYVTAKLRGSYGRSTRPPQSKFKTALTGADFYGPSLWPSFFADYGNFDYQLANPQLAPEHQQGGEGGLELYLGTRGSLVVTRYNQTVDGLIDQPIADSIDVRPELQEVLGGWVYPMYQRQYLNIGSIRNQGWELQGIINIGPLATHGTYSWVKSRTIGVDTKYRRYFANQPQYQPGATFQYLPEHTWAIGMTYTNSASSASFNVAGTGRVMNGFDDLYFRSLINSIRLPQNRQSVTALGGRYISSNRGYALADLTAAHRFSYHLEGVLQIQNIADFYKNDQYGGYASLGRQGRISLRIR